MWDHVSARTQNMAYKGLLLSIGRQNHDTVSILASQAQAAPIAGILLSSSSKEFYTLSSPLVWETENTTKEEKNVYKPLGS